MGVFRKVKTMIDEATMISRGLLHRQNIRGRSSCSPIIDIVVTWVDESDQKWLADKEYHLNQVAGDRKSGNGACRYRKWDFFRYWFRAIEAYAPWVNCVYFVTYGHIPDWLNTESPKLKIVRHDEFIPAEYLPTFSSIPIEFNLHRIKGLNENFIYFNDDLFLSRPCLPEDFFVEEKPVLCPVPAPLYFLRNDASSHIMFSTYSEINAHNDISKAIYRNAHLWYSPQNMRHFGLVSKAYRNNAIFGMSFSHMGVPFVKSTMEKAWDKYESIAQTCTHKFRTPMDVMHYLFTAEDILSGNFIPCKTNHYGKILNMEDYETIESIFRKKDNLMVCFNDSNSYTREKVKEINSNIGRILQFIFPEKSGFEK